MPFHRFDAGSDRHRIPVVLLHGSGGDEGTLLPLADELAPGAPTLALRGAVEIDGGFAFFHRNADRSINEPDIRLRIPTLAGFISTFRDFTRPPVLIGFSNGAIMAAALLLTHPRSFSGGILFRPLSPFDSDLPTQLDATRVLIIDGEKDSRRSPGDGARLADRMVRAGATVTHHVLPVGHAISEMDRRIARDWLADLR